ncbi:hypothetical protein YC2023_068046 [Brassica napus]
MAVEAHHLNHLYSSNNRERMNPVEANGLVYNTQMRYNTVQATTVLIDTR